jgi:hypothetical protein
LRAAPARIAVHAKHARHAATAEASPDQTRRLIGMIDQKTRAENASKSMSVKSSMARLAWLTSAAEWPNVWLGHCRCTENNPDHTTRL